MMARQLLLVAAYAEMAAGVLLGGVTLLCGPLALGRPLSPMRAPVGDTFAMIADAKLIELRLCAVVFALGLLLLVSSAFAMPEGMGVRRAAEQARRPGARHSRARRARALPVVKRGQPSASAALG